MFKPNEGHEQSQMFAPEDQMHPRLKKMLEKNWSDIFYEKIFRNINEDIFKSLYSDKFGRGNFPVNILVGLEMIKELFSLSDEQLFDRYHFDLLVRRAFGLNDINEHILAQRTLYYFRSSLAEHELLTGENLLMQVFTDDRDRTIQELGLKTGLQRTDSTMIGANIKKMSRLMLFHKVLSNLVIDLIKMDISIPKDVQELLKDDEDGFAYRLKKEEVLSKTKEVGEYIYRFMIEHDQNTKVLELKSYKDAERLLREQCNIKKRKLKLKEPKDISSSSMQNPADGDATYKKKNNKGYRGYAAHATETCDKENPIQVITDIDLVGNNEDDAKVLSGKIEKLEKETGLETIIGDGAFASDDVRDECKENNVNLITSAIRGRPSDKESEGMLTSRDFDIDKDTGKMNCCPDGVAPRSQKVTDKSLTANFDSKRCQKCEKKNICPAFSSDKLSKIAIDDRRKWLDERHELLKTQEYRDKCNLRPPVEGLMEKIKPKYLSGRTLFRGLEKVKTRMILKAIGVNFRRYKGYKTDLSGSFIKQIYLYTKNIFCNAKLAFQA